MSILYVYLLYDVYVGDRVSSVRHERGKRLWFNVSEVPVSENIVGAELRIYKNSNLTNFDPDDQFIVAAYQLIRTDDGFVFMNADNRINKLNVKYVFFFSEKENWNLSLL